MKNRDKIAFHEWKEFKKYFGVKNSDIGTILGYDPKSVQNATAPSYNGPFPSWAKLAIWVWKKCLDRETLLKAEIVKLKSQSNEIQTKSISKNK